MASSSEPWLSDPIVGPAPAATKNPWEADPVVPATELAKMPGFDPVQHFDSVRQTTPDDPAAHQTALDLAAQVKMLRDNGQGPVRTWADTGASALAGLKGGAQMLAQQAVGVPRAVTTGVANLAEGAVSLFADPTTEEAKARSARIDRRGAEAAAALELSGQGPLSLAMKFANAGPGEGETTALQKQSARAQMESELKYWQGTPGPLAQKRAADIQAKLAVAPAPPTDADVQGAKLEDYRKKIIDEAALAETRRQAASGQGELAKTTEQATPEELSKRGETFNKPDSLSGKEGSFLGTPVEQAAAGGSADMLGFGVALGGVGKVAGAATRLPGIGPLTSLMGTGVEKLARGGVALVPGLGGKAIQLAGRAAGSEVADSVMGGVAGAAGGSVLGPLGSVAGGVAGLAAGSAAGRSAAFKSLGSGLEGIGNKSMQVASDLFSGVPGAGKTAANIGDLVGGGAREVAKQGTLGAVTNAPLAIFSDDPVRSLAEGVAPGIAFGVAGMRGNRQAMREAAAQNLAREGASAPLAPEARAAYEGLAPADRGAVDLYRGLFARVNPGLEVVPLAGDAFAQAAQTVGGRGGERGFFQRDAATGAERIVLNAANPDLFGTAAHEGGHALLNGEVSRLFGEATQDKLSRSVGRALLEPQLDTNGQPIPDTFDLRRPTPALIEAAKGYSERMGKEFDPSNPRDAEYIANELLAETARSLTSPEGIGGMMAGPMPGERGAAFLRDRLADIFPGLRRQFSDIGAAEIPQATSAVREALAEIGTAARERTPARQGPSGPFSLAARFDPAGETLPALADVRETRSPAGPLSGEGLPTPTPASVPDAAPQAITRPLSGGAPLPVAPKPKEGPLSGPIADPKLTHAREQALLVMTLPKARGGLGMSRAEAERKLENNPGQTLEEMLFHAQKGVLPSEVGGAEITTRPPAVGDIAISPSDLTPLVRFIVDEAGGIMPIGEARRRNRYDQNSELWEAWKGLDPSAQRTMRGTVSPDAVLQAAIDAGILRPGTSVDEMIAAAMKEIQSARRVAVQTYEGQKQMKQIEAFRTALTRPPKKGAALMEPKDLEVGGEVELAGEVFRVTKRDPETGELTIEDGAKFGTQRIAGDGVLAVERYSPPEPVAEAATAPAAEAPKGPLSVEPAPPAAPEMPLTGREVAPPVETKPRSEPVTSPLPEDAIVQAERDFTPLPQKKHGTPEQQFDKELWRQHAEALSGRDDGRVTARTDERTGRTTVRGKFFVPGDAVHDRILARNPEVAAETLTRIQEAIDAGLPVTVDYFSAAPTREARTAAARAEAQAESSAGDRAAGRTPGVDADKAILPSGFVVSKDGKISLRGFSVDKFTGNAEKLLRIMGDAGIPLPFESVNDPRLVEAFNAYVQNHRAGWKGDGSAKLRSTEGVRVPDIDDPTFEPTKLPREVADFINLALANEGAKAKGPRGQDAREFSAANEGPLSGDGEVNSLRARLNESGMLKEGPVERVAGPLTDGVQSIQEQDRGSRNVLESTSETINADLILRLKEGAPTPEGTNLRATEFKGERGAVVESGAPRADFVAAGFLPAKKGAPKEGEFEEVAAKLADYRRRLSDLSSAERKDWERVADRYSELKDLQEKARGDDPGAPEVNHERLAELGTTTDFKEAGYIRPDGKLVDLSGKREGGQRGTRSYDHREAGGTSGMLRFMKDGAVRLQPESGGMDIAAKPNFAQEGVLKRYIESNGGEVVVDLADGIGTWDAQRRSYTGARRTASVEFPAGTKAVKVIGIIKRFYNGEDIDSGVRFLPASPEGPLSGRQEEVDVRPGSGRVRGPLSDLEPGMDPRSLAPGRSIAPRPLSGPLGDAENVAARFLPKRITPEQDREYLRAVEAGDMEAAREKVGEAAAAAGYTLGPVYKSLPHTDWRTGEPINELKSTNGPWAGFFSDDRSVAERFARLSGVPGSRRVLEAFVKIERPFEVNATGKAAGQLQFDIPKHWTDQPYSQQNNKEILAALESGKHDTIILRNTDDEGTVIVPLRSDQVKLADPVTRDDSGRVIPLSERFNPKSDDIRFLPALAERMVEKFGTTKDPREAGFVLPDGGMIDLSGGEKGRRPVEHSYAAGGHDAMDKLAADGVMRLEWNLGGVALGKEPTSAQLDVIRRLAEQHEGMVAVDLQDGDRNANFMFAHNTDPRRLVGYVRRFYRGEDIPDGVRFLPQAASPAEARSAIRTYRELAPMRERGERLSLAQSMRLDEAEKVLGQEMLGFGDHYFAPAPQKGEQEELSFGPLSGPSGPQAEQLALFLARGGGSARPAATPTPPRVLGPLSGPQDDRERRVTGKR